MICCKDCPDRTVEPNCHTTCEKYKAFKKEIELEKQRKKDEQYLFIKHKRKKVYK